MRFQSHAVLAQMALVLAISGLAGCNRSPGGSMRTPSTEPFFEVPKPDFDLRTMLRRHVIRRSVEVLESAAAKRSEAIRNRRILAYGEKVRTLLRESFGNLPYGLKGGALNIRMVSTYRRTGYRIENLLFESFPGWDVNASVYLPLDDRYPPPWPAIVMPVGHNPKQAENQQIPAQVFARCGYLVIFFDAPGWGEKAAGNDHFNDGVRCYLTGLTSQRYFIMDALRAVDYLSTRRDVNMTDGVGITGLSGGGVTTLYAALLDDRIKVVGPSCFSAPEIVYPVKSGGAPCPETLYPRRYQRGLDTADLLVAACPKPLLLMGGKNDVVFKPEWNQELAHESARAYAGGGFAERFRFFLDSSGHAYTVAQALEFVRWMDRWVRRTSDRQLPKIAQEDLELVPPRLLRCHPRPDQNIFTLNRTAAERLVKEGSSVPIREAAMRLAGIGIKDLASAGPPVSKSGKPFRVLFDYFEEILLKVESDIELPGTVLYDVNPQARNPGILYFDDRGRWQQLGKGDMLGDMAHFVKKDGHKPVLLTVDVRGWGDTEPAFAPWEVAGYGSPQRFLAYVSSALGDPVLGMRIRDGLAALAYLRSRPEVDKAQVIVGGRGMGGIVALHVAAIDRNVRAVFASDIPACFLMLAQARTYAWKHDAFYPGVLNYYDLPQLLADLRMPVLLVNPLDAMKRPITESAARQLYSQPLSRKNFEVRTRLTEAADATQITWVDQQIARMCSSSAPTAARPN
jgi:cephalosporin-C deacetylase-like acetyl esterase